MQPHSAARRSRPDAVTAWLLRAGAAITLAAACWSTAWADDPPSLPRHHIIAAENGMAAQAGLAILREGGSAVDAAIAAQMVLTLVEPQATGIGGGALLLYYDAATRKVTAWDGRETAPAAAGPDLFLDRDGKPLGYVEGGIGGRAVGVPGVLRMLEAAHRAHGKLPWSNLFTDAIKLAEGGIAVPKRMAEAIALDAPRLQRQAAIHDAFFQRDGTPLRPGAPYVNKTLADTLRLVAAGGANALMTGPIAAEIATAVRTDPNPGLLTADDLGAYQAKQRAVLCAPYRDHRVCGFGPPTAGGATVLETLNMLAHFDMPAMAPAAGATWGTDAAQLMMEAQRLAHADRLQYLADTDFVPVPLGGLLDRTYAAIRAQAIDVDHANPAPRAGNPDWTVPDPAFAPSLPQPEHGTSEIAVIDDAGNAVSMTTTVQDRFGARLMVRGFVLNNELTDFSALPDRDGRPIANRVEPGKRPRSAMAPTFVFDDSGRLEMITGSVGGAAIISYVAQALVETLDFHRTPQEAVASPRIATTGAAVLLEAGTPAVALAAPLEARGQKVTTTQLDSGTIIVRLTPDGFVGATDPRREGAALGD
jgi:gamma-glutamyltranspeptidase/glutathione hydrolase